MNVVFLTSPYDIKMPNLETEYHIDRSYAAQSNLVIKLAGEKEIIEKLTLLNIFTKNFQAIAGYRASSLYSSNDKLVHFIPKKLLPKAKQHAFLPGLIYDEKEPEELVLMTEITIKVERDSFPTPLDAINKIYISRIANSLKTEKLNDKLTCQTKELVDKCAALIAPKPVKSGQFPIFLSSQQPSAEVLEDIYKKFLYYNDKTKLAKQAAYSDGQCYHRASFLSIVLSFYGIESIKVYQVWPRLKPLPINELFGWPYHCVAMTFNNRGEPAIWDPWHLPTERLFMLNQWMNYYKEKSEGECVYLGNPYVLNSHTTSLFEHVTQFEDCNTIKRLIEDAIPNTPEKPLALARTYSFFTHNENKKLLVKPNNKTSESASLIKTII